MAVKDVELVGAKFHPRFDATSRRYRYRLFSAEVRDPLCEGFAWRVWPPFDPDLLIEIAGVFPGRHDFAAFGSAPVKKAGRLAQ